MGSKMQHKNLYGLRLSCLRHTASLTRPIARTFPCGSALQPLYANLPTLLCRRNIHHGRSVGNSCQTAEICTAPIRYIHIYFPFYRVVDNKKHILSVDKESKIPYISFFFTIFASNIRCNETLREFKRIY